MTRYDFCMTFASSRNRPPKQKITISVNSDIVDQIDDMVDGIYIALAVMQ